MTVVPMRQWIPALLALGLLTGCTSTANSVAPPPAPPSAVPSVSAVAVPHTSWDVTDFPDPCRTITGTEVGSIVGLTVDAGRKLDSWPPLCQFALNAQGPLSLYVSDDSGATGREDYDRKRSLSAATEAVSGIGDQAYWQPDIAQFHVMLGDTHVFVGFGGTPTPDGAKDQALAIARLILTRAHTS
jgi:hypothetical protein